MEAQDRPADRVGDPVPATTEEITEVQTIRLATLTRHDAQFWLGPAVHTYVTAMGYPQGTEQHRIPLWRDHLTRTGWFAVGAFTTVARDAIDGPELTRLRVHGPVSVADCEILIGIAYGYRGAPDQWWNQQLRAGLRQTGRSPEEITSLTTDYFELTELHVHPIAQGRGIGRLLLTRLLADRPEARVLLSTPESAEPNRAWSLYRRLGFGDVLRHFSFNGDPRPFAFLGRDLPLPAPDREISREGQR